MGASTVNEAAYVGLLFALFVLPRILLRYRIPAAITALALGAAVALGLGWFVGDPTVRMLATFGIVSLFLFAGLEVDVGELAREWRVLLQHVLVGTGALALTAWAFAGVLGLEWRVAVLVSLAVLTPSTGFILESLGTIAVNEGERRWIKVTAIATEIVALLALFFTLQSITVGRLVGSTLVLGLLIVLLPLSFRVFAQRIVPFAPKSEFAFLLMTAVLAAVITRELGVYYLVGAFIVGVAAQRFRADLPAMASEQMLHAIEVFASVFVPFYFFHAGLRLRGEDFGLETLVAGAVLLALFVPLRIALVVAHRRLALREPWRKGARVGLSLVPSLVFTLVLAGILRDRFAVPPYLYGALIVYALVNTPLPSLVLRVPPPEFEAPRAPEIDAEPA